MKKHSSMRRTFAVLLIIGLVSAMFMALPVFAGSDGTEESAQTIFSLEDLAGKVVGVQTGTTGDIYISDDSNLKLKGVERYNTGFEAVQALSQNKIDAVVIDDQPAQAFVAQMNGLTILDTEYVKEDYAMAVQKGNTELLGKLNEAIAALQENGTLKTIIDFYIDHSGEGYTSPKGVKHPNGELVMATNAEFPPYEYYDDNNEIVGIDADLAKAIGDYLGYEVTISDMKFDSIITSVATGKAQFGMAGLTVTEERQQSIDFTNPYYTGKQVVIVRKSAGAQKETIIDRFKRNFLQAGRWKMLLSGLGVTLLITFFSTIFGVLIGFLVAIIRSTHDKTGSLRVLNIIAQIYTTVIRGTPTVVQLLIIYYVVFASVNIPKVVVAVIAFSMNSGAYISEIIRSGIMSIDEGQFEAGRSLGFNYARTMRYFILPQAFTNVVPALGNEFITLLKETSISGYIAINDLTKIGDVIRSRTYDAFMPLVTVALVYLLLVFIFARLWGVLEGRLRRNG